VLIRSSKLGTLPPVERVRSRPWIAVAVAVGALLVLGWLTWAIYVAADRGAREGLGVLIAWPALVAAVLLICLPFVLVYLLVRRQGDSDAAAAPPVPRGEPEA